MAEENQHFIMNTIVRSVDGDNKNSVLISNDFDQRFRKELRDTIRGYTTTKLTDKIIGVERHFGVVGVSCSNILTCCEYENILFVPSFRNNNYPTLMDANYEVMKSNASQHMIPIVNKRFEQSPNIYVAYPEGHSSMYHDLMVEFGVTIIPSSGMYSMGDENYTVTPPDGVKFDCVYLAGHDIREEETYSAADIKEDFASVCQEEFDLVDHYEDDRDRLAVFREHELENHPRLTGTEKDMSTIFDYVSSTSVRQDNYQGKMPEVIRKAIRKIMSQSIKFY